MFYIRGYKISPPLHNLLKAHQWKILIPDIVEDNIRMDLREIVWKSVDWMHLAQDR
jgi:hypothetical protein